MRGFDAAAVEPLVGELQAVRGFELGDDGYLFPVVPASQPWVAGTNTAACVRGVDHHAPAVGCTCGFYGYFHPRFVARGAVAAIVSMWGEAIIGTRGVRAEHAKVVAVVVPADVPDEVRRAVASRYPEVTVYTDVDAMTAAHPLSRPAGVRHPRLRRGPAIDSLWSIRAALTVGVLALPVVGWIERAAHIEARGLWLWLWLLAAAVACTSLVATLGPVRRWREALRISPSAWVCLVAVPWLAGPPTWARVGALGAAAALCVRAVIRDRALGRPTPVKPNLELLDQLRLAHSPSWQVQRTVRGREFVQIDSTPAGRRTFVRYVSQRRPGKINTALRRPRSVVRVGAGMTATMSNNNIACFFEARPSSGWVDVLPGRALDTQTDAATITVQALAGALGITAPALARHEFAPDETPAPATRRAPAPKRRR